MSLTRALLRNTAIILPLLLLCWGAAILNEDPCNASNPDSLLKLGSEFLSKALEKLETKELSKINESVCALFDEYSRLFVTLENHNENDSISTNLTLLISEKVLKDSCKYTRKTNSSVNCSSISSISEHCFKSRVRAEEAITSLAGEGLITNMDAHPSCWLTQFYQDICPESEVWEALLEEYSSPPYNCKHNGTSNVKCEGLQ